VKTILYHVKFDMVGFSESWSAYSSAGQGRPAPTTVARTLPILS